MIEVDVIAASPAYRAGVAALLDAAGLRVAGQHARWDDVPRDSTSVRVWLAATPFAAPDARPAAQPCVLLCDDAHAATWLQNSGLPGWALLTADAPAAVMHAAVQAAHHGLVVIDPRFAAQALAPAPAPADDISLTPRETEVLELIAQGLPNKGIAARLQISDSTVKFHLQSAFAKLGAASRAEAVSQAARRGLITL